MDKNTYIKAKTLVKAFREEIETINSTTREQRYITLVNAVKSLGFTSVDDVILYERENFNESISEYADNPFKKIKIRLVESKGYLHQEAILRTNELIPDTVYYKFFSDNIIHVPNGTTLDGINLEYCKDNNIELATVCIPVVSSKISYLLRGKGYMQIKGVLKKYIPTNNFVTKITKDILEYLNIPDVTLSSTNDVLCKGSKVGGSFAYMDGVLSFSCGLSYAFDKIPFKDAIKDSTIYDRVNSVHTLTGITLTDSSVLEALKLSIKDTFGDYKFGTLTKDELDNCGGK